MATGPSKHPVTPLKPGQSIAAGIPEEYYDLIGRVVVQWSWLDGALDGLIWDFFDLTDDDGRIVTTRMDADPKIQMLRSLVARYAPTRVNWFKALAADIDTLRLERNFIVHGSWATLMPDNIPMAFSLKPKADPGHIVGETFLRGRFENLIKNIVLVRDHINTLADELTPLRSRLPKQPLP